MLVPPCKFKTLFTAFVVSVFVFITSLVLILAVFPGIIENKIKQNVQLIKGTQQYERFLELPFPINFKIFFFHVTNPNEILQGSKPVLQEVGPYIYNEYTKKEVESVNEEDDTISYRQYQKFEFNKDSSGTLSDDDYITALNPPLESMLQMAEEFRQAGVLSNCFSHIFENMDTLFIRVKVKDILFNGIQFCKRHLSVCEFRSVIACKAASTLRNINKLSDGSLSFSYFNYKSAKDDGLYTVKRGIKDIQSLGRIVKWNNDTHTAFWKQQQDKSVCDEVKGSESTLYPPGVKKTDAFQVYSTDICRYMEVRFFKEETYKGVEGYTFATDNTTLWSRSPNKLDDCFCSRRTKGVNGDKVCFLDGAVDMQPCIGTPILLSFPHFLGADRSYVENVEGLSPREHLHNTFLTLEPNTGTPLQGAKRVQINAVLRPIADVGFTQNLTRVVIPLFWVEESVYLSDEHIQELKDLYFNKKLLVDVFMWLLFAVSLTLTLILGLCLMYKRFFHASNVE